MGSLMLVWRQSSLKDYNEVLRRCTHALSARDHSFKAMGGAIALQPLFEDLGDNIASSSLST